MSSLENQSYNPPSSLWLDCRQSLVLKVKIRKSQLIVAAWRKERYVFPIERFLGVKVPNKSYPVVVNVEIDHAKFSSISICVLSHRRSARDGANVSFHVDHLRRYFEAPSKKFV